MMHLQEAKDLTFLEGVKSQGNLTIEDTVYTGRTALKHGC